MSRIGRKPIPVPAGVKISTTDGKVEVQGPKGKLRVLVPSVIKLEQKDGVLTALPLMGALNQGAAPANGYRAVTDALDVFQDIADRLPVPVRQRLVNAYATLELADSANQLAIGQMGVGRMQGPLMQQSIDHVEADNANAGDAFQSQTALLERLTAASAIQLRQS